MRPLFEWELKTLGWMVGVDKVGCVVSPLICLGYALDYGTWDLWLLVVLVGSLSWLRWRLYGYWTGSKR